MNPFFNVPVVGNNAIWFVNDGAVGQISSTGKVTPYEGRFGA